jgi:hypothetical protein
MQNEKAKLYLNRILSFLVGGALVFAVMSVSVVADSKRQVAELKQKLDVALYEPGTLLNEAKADFSSKKYRESMVSLDSLFEKHPGSPEAIEGRTLYDSMTAAEKKADDKWAAAVAGVKRKWVAAESLRLWAQAEQDMTVALNQGWEGAKDKARADWERD